MTETDSKRGINAEELTCYALKGAVAQAIGSVPFLGGMILGMLEGVEEVRAQQMMNELTHEVKRLGEDKLDLSFINSEEFLDLFCKAIRARSRHRSKMKAKLLVSLISESIQIDRSKKFNVEMKETFVSLIDKLSDEEILFLYDFAVGVYKEKSKKDIYECGDKSKAIVLDMLLSNGILREDETWAKHIKESMLGGELIAYMQILAEES